MIFLAKLLLTSITFAGPNDALLESQLYKPWRVHKDVKVPFVDDVNTLLSEADRRKWFQRVGRILSKDEMSALKAMVSTARCEFEESSTTRIQPQDCKASQGSELYMCSGKAKCVTAGMTFHVGALCFTSTDKCPPANECALDAHVDLKMGSESTFEKEPKFTSMWAGGYPVEPRRK